MDYTPRFDEASVPETQDEKKTFFLKLHLTAAENNESRQCPFCVRTIPLILLESYIKRCLFYWSFRFGSQCQFVPPPPMKNKNSEIKQTRDVKKARVDSQVQSVDDEETDEEDEDSVQDSIWFQKFDGKG